MWGDKSTNLEAHSVVAAEVGEMTHANPGDCSYQQLAGKLTGCRVEKGGQRSTLEAMVSMTREGTVGRTGSCGDGLER